MTFWSEVAAGFLANLFAAVLLVILYVAIQWFLAATDVTIGYGWRFDGTQNNPRNMRPSFDIRNRSRSRTYYLANVAYLRDNHPVAPFDNSSVWGRELKPGSIERVEAAPVESLTSLRECTGIEVHVRLQNGRIFWLKGTGPGQSRTEGLSEQRSGSEANSKGRRFRWNRASVTLVCLLHVALQDAAARSLKGKNDNS